MLQAGMCPFQLLVAEVFPAFGTGQTSAAQLVLQIFGHQAVLTALVYVNVGHCPCLWCFLRQNTQTPWARSKHGLDVQCDNTDLLSML